MYGRWNEIRIRVRHCPQTGKILDCETKAYWRGEPAFRSPPGLWILTPRLKKVIRDWNDITADCGAEG